MAHPRVLAWTRENTSLNIPNDEVDESLEFWDD